MKIWEPTKCCCCCDVRTGSIVIGVFILVGSALTLLNGVQMLAMQGTSVFENICESESQYASKVEECEEELKKIMFKVGCSSIAEACFHILFSSLLLYGIVKKKTALFLPLMIVYTVLISLMILGITALIILLIYMGVPFAFIFFFALFSGLIIFLETYCLLVIRAHYYEIKREKGHVHITLTEECPPYHDQQADPNPGSQVPPYPGSQVPPYPGSQVPPYPGSQVPPYPVSQVPPYPSSQAPPYSYIGNEVPPYPGSDVPLYPDEKNVK